MLSAWDDDEEVKHPAIHPQKTGESTGTLRIEERYEALLTFTSDKSEMQWTEKDSMVNLVVV